MKRTVFISLLSLLHFSSFANEPQIHGAFQNDTLKIGYPIEYALSISYPSEWQIFFPDSSYDYSPFEFYSKEVFTTKSNDSLSKDSVVYQLMSFELDSVQKLSLPVYRLHLGDTVELMSNLDSAMLKEYIETLPQDLDLKENSGHWFIPDIFDRKFWLIVAGVIVSTLILIGLVFGKRILKSIKAYFLKRNHQKFIEEFEGRLSDIKTEAKREFAEGANAHWKNYLSELEGIPYNTYSSREFLDKLGDKELIEHLKNLDAFIYGGYKQENLVESMVHLMHYAQDRFEMKRKEVLDA